MDGRRSTNQFNTSTAISLITLLLRRNGFHLATVPAAGTRREYFIDVRIVLFKIQRMITADGVLSLMHMIYNIQMTFTQSSTVIMSCVLTVFTQSQEEIQPCFVFFWFFFTKQP